MKLGTLSQHPSSTFWNGWSSFPAGCGQKGSVTSLHVDPFSCLSALVPERTARRGLCPFLSPEGAPLCPGLHPVTPLSGCLPSALSIPPAHWYSVFLGHLSPAALSYGCSCSWPVSFHNLPEDRDFLHLHPHTAFCRDLWQVLNKIWFYHFH